MKVHACVIEVRNGSASRNLRRHSMRVVADLRVEHHCGTAHVAHLAHGTKMILRPEICRSTYRLSVGEELPRQRPTRITFLGSLTAAPHKLLRARCASRLNDLDVTSAGIVRKRTCLPASRISQVDATTLTLASAMPMLLLPAQ